MNIVWTPEAIQDRADIWDYLHARNPQAAIDQERIWILTRLNTARQWPPMRIR